MCGIAGIIRYNQPFKNGEIEKMTRALTHRGPDDEGFFILDSVAIGHRRLAIIDLESGQQPMSNEDGKIWITFNGEIYNYLELKNELQQKGHRFTTESDTEVIIHSYEEWGSECVKKFRGMFAFGLVDFNKNKLFLARDHFGIKPLYYRIGSGYFAFASELPALRKVDDESPLGSLQAVDFYLRFQYIPTPYTIYKSIFKLPPASSICIDFNGHIEEPLNYWNMLFEPDDSLSDQEWQNRVEEVIFNSVKAHLVADVPFGVFLSGGIDSTFVALQMSKILQRPIKAFAIGFDEKEYSELEYAEEAARRCGIELHTEIVKVDSLDILPDLVAHFGEPFGDSSAIPTWYVSQLARKHVPMVLSGDGGDETFGGYQSYVNWMNSDWQTSQRKNISPIRDVRLASKAMLKYLMNKSKNNLDEWQKHILYMNLKSRRALWRKEYQYLVTQPCSLFEKASVKAENLDRLAYAQYIDYQTYLPCDILTKVDIASMYHGLEVRTPLIDLHVNNLAVHLPLSQRFQHNSLGIPIGKYILKQILSKTFPTEFVHRKKQGFAIPRSIWFLPGNQGYKLLEQVLYSDSLLTKWFNPDQIKAHLVAHNTKHDNSGVLWLLLVLGLWLEQNPEIQFK